MITLFTSNSQNFSSFSPIMLFLANPEKILVITLKFSDKYFEGIDEDLPENGGANIITGDRTADFGIKEYMPKSSFKLMSSFKLGDYGTLHPKTTSFLLEIHIKNSLLEI